MIDDIDRIVLSWLPPTAQIDTIAVVIWHLSTFGSMSDSSWIAGWLLPIASKRAGHRVMADAGETAADAE